MKDYEIITPPGNKTDITIEIEQRLFKKIKKPGIRVAFEVRVPTRRYVREVVELQGYADLVSINYNDDLGYPIIDIYEIKTSLNDMKSKNGHNFVGDNNYYVLTQELFDEIVEKDAQLLSYGGGNYAGHVGILVYKNGRFYTKREADTRSYNKRLRVHERFKIIDHAMSRLEWAGFKESIQLNENKELLK